MLRLCRGFFGGWGNVSNWLVKGNVGNYLSWLRFSWGKDNVGY